MCSPVVALVAFSAISTAYQIKSGQDAAAKADKQNAQALDAQKKTQADAEAQAKAAQDAADKIGPAPTITDPTLADTQARKRKLIDSMRNGIASTIKNNQSPALMLNAAQPNILGAGIKTRLGL